MLDRSPVDRLTEWINYVILTGIVVIVLYPLYFVLLASFSSPEAVLRGEVWLWPVNPTVIGYERIIQNEEVWTGYANTFLYTALGTAINLIMTVLAAYPLSRKDFAGKHVITVFIVFTMFFSGGLVPTYLLIKSLGMLNTVWSMVIPGAVSVWYILIMRTFFQTSIPYEVQEAAAIDGCSATQTLIRVVLPMSMPILAVMVLFYCVGHWNAFFQALIYLSERSKYPLQLFLREILLQDQMQDMVKTGGDTLVQSVLETESVKYAMVIVANLPVLVLYPFLQKYFVKGVVVGAIKG